MRSVLSVLAALLASSTLALSGVTTTNVNVRAQPSATSATLATLNSGTRVNVASCGVTWCTLTAPSRGYIAKAYVAFPGATPTTPTHPGTYTNVDGVRVQRPTFSATVPAGASAQCRDGSYSFSLNRRGTCSRHGGVARWF